MKNEEKKADMYLPTWVLGTGIFFAVCAVAATIIAFVIGNMAILLCDIPFLLIFVAAYLCWKNQKIRILDDLTFEYSTMFGNRKTYAFSQITQVKQNPDSYTVLPTEIRYILRLVPFCPSVLLINLNHTEYLFSTPPAVTKTLLWEVCFIGLNEAVIKIHD